MTDEQTKPEPMLTVDDVADWLQLNPDVVRRKAAANEIPAYKVGGQWRFKRQEVAQMIAEGQRAAIREDS